MAEHSGRVIYLKVSSVKSTDIGSVPYQFGQQTHCFLGTPECKLNFPFCGVKTLPFSCMAAANFQEVSA